MPLLLDAAGVAPPVFFLLRALAMERDPGVGMTEAEMIADLDNPYATFRPELARLPALVSMGYVAHDGDTFTVTSTGRALVRHIEAAKDAYLATLSPIPHDDLSRLLGTLEAIAARLWVAPEPAAKPHQTRIRRAAPAPDAAPMARLLAAVYALWYARDDAHTAAWRAAGFDGPAFDLLNHVWSGDARTVAQLTDKVSDTQRPDDVACGLASLIASGYLTADGDLLSLTDIGQQTRDAIETETDRIYFASWPDADDTWIRRTFAAVLWDA